MAEKINGRLAYADLLRVFASLAVIVCHLASRQISAVAVGSQNWQVFNLYNGLARWCVPVLHTHSPSPSCCYTTVCGSWSV